MTVREHVCLDNDLFPNGSLDRELPTVDLRLHALDYDPFSPIVIHHAKAIPPVALRSLTRKATLFRGLGSRGISTGVYSENTR